jgi:hypothetical protein
MDEKNFNFPIYSCGLFSKRVEERNFSCKNVDDVGRFGSAVRKDNNNLHVCMLQMFSFDDGVVEKREGREE